MSKPQPKAAPAAALAATNEDPVDELLERVSEPPREENRSLTSDAVETAIAAGLGTARLIEVTGRTCRLQLRGRAEPVDAVVDEGVEVDLLAEATKNGDLALVEHVDGEVVVLGIVQRRRPRELTINAETITVEATRELLLRAGRAALRIREDGDVELVGSRISASSRGLFRLVGRMLRLN